MYLLFGVEFVILAGVVAVPSWRDVVALLVAGVVVPVDEVVGLVVGSCSNLVGEALHGGRIQNLLASVVGHLGLVGFDLHAEQPVVKHVQTVYEQLVARRNLTELVLGRLQNYLHLGMFAVLAPLLRVALLI